MNQHIPTQNFTKRLVILPTGAPCPLCPKGELYEHPGGRVFGCDSCLGTFTANDLDQLADDMLIDAPAELMELHEHITVCLTDEAHVKQILTDHDDRAILQAARVHFPNAVMVSEECDPTKSNLEFGSAAWFAGIPEEEF